MSAPQKIDLSIVIINYNTLELTKNCIQSIYDETKSSSFEIILIDNASSENAESIKELFPKIHFIQSQLNTGFGAANNIGIEKAKGEFILLLNSDTIITNNALDKSVQFMSSHFAIENNIGLMGCKLLYQNGEHQNSVFYKYSSFSALINSNPLLNALFGKSPIKNKDSHFVAGVSGAFMFFRSGVFKKIEAFDPDIFMYSEETELCRNRVGKFFKIYYWTGASVIHLMGKSSNPEKAYQQNFVSYAFTIYKTGLLHYFVFLVSLVLNMLTSFILYPYFLMKKNNFELMRIKGYFILLDYFFYKIPLMSRAWGSNNKQLKIKFFKKPEL